MRVKHNTVKYWLQCTTLWGYIVVCPQLSDVKYNDKMWQKCVQFVKEIETFYSNSSNFKNEKSLAVAGCEGFSVTIVI